MKARILLVLLILPILLTFTVPLSSTVQAQGTGPCRDSYAGFLGFPTWYKYLPKTSGPSGCEVSVVKRNGTTDIAATAGRVLLAVVDVLLRVAGVVSLGFVIFGGFTYMTSQGAPDKTAAAKDTIVNALVGLVIAVLAATIVGFVGGVFL